MRLTLLVLLLPLALAAQSPMVRIQVHFPEFSQNGLALVPINTPEHGKAIQDLLADDGPLLAPLLPYSVILVNGSGRKLLGVGVEYSWRDATGNPGGQQLMLTALTKQGEPKIIHPGGIQVFTPSEAASVYLSISAVKRKAPPLGVSFAGRLEDEILQNIQGFTGFTSFRAALDSVVFEDYSYLGASNTFEMLQRRHPEIHK